MEETIDVEKIEKEIQVKEPKEQPKPIALENGLLSTKDSNEEWRVAQLMLSSKSLPKHFESVPQVMMAVQFLKSFGFNPFTAIRQTMIVNGSISIWGDLPLSLCQKSGELESIREFIIDKDYKEICFENHNLSAEMYAGVCMIKRKGRELVTKAFTVDDAVSAGLWGGNVWKKFPKRMIQMRTRSLALKDVFSDILSGVSINEYDIDGMNYKSNIANELNNEFLEKDESQKQDDIEFN